MATKVDERFKKIDLAIAHLDKQFGAGSVFRFGEENIKPWPAISTGALGLDIILGIGGLPKGRVVEVFGPESSGKSTLCLSVVANAQAAGGICAYIDAEHSVDPNYARALGVNMDDLLFSQPDYGEMALDITETLIRTGILDVIVIDSVAALTPKAEIDGDMLDGNFAPIARMMSKAMRKLVGIANENETLILFTNQLREKVGIMFGNPEITPGGRALKFAASVRLDLRRVEDIKNTETGEVRGIKVRAKVPKNKMAPPLKMCEFDILYGEGIDQVGCIVDIAIESSIFVKSGTWYKWNDVTYAQGRKNLIATLKEDPTTLEAVKAALSEKFKPQQAPQPVEEPIVLDIDTKEFYEIEGL